MSTKQNYWLKTVNKSSFPKLFNGSIHLLNENLLLMTVISNQKLTVYTINIQKMSIEERYVPNLDECQNFDQNFLHPQNFLINNKIYMLKNCLPSDDQHLIILDLQSKIVYPIKCDETRPSSFKIQYSVCQYDYGLLMFGGLNQNLVSLNSLEIFDVIYYKWKQVETKGIPPSPRHSHVAQIYKDNMIVLGGTNQTDIFQKHKHFQDLYILNLENYQWTQVQMKQRVPGYLAFNYSFIDKNQNLIVFWMDRLNGKNETNVSQLNLNSYEWVTRDIHSKMPDFRLGAAVCINNEQDTIYYYGGFHQDKQETIAISNQLDQFMMNQTIQDDVKIELYDDDKQCSLIQIDDQIPKQKLNNLIIQTNNNQDIDIDDGQLSDEMTFEQLLEQEKLLLQQEQSKVSQNGINNQNINQSLPTKKKKSKKSKKK